MIKMEREEIVKYVLYVVLLIGFCISIWASFIAPLLSQQLLALSVTIAIFGVIANMWLSTRSIGLLKKQMETGRVIEALKAINSLKSDFVVKIRRIDRYVSGELVVQSDLLIRPDYKYVHENILGKRNCDKIKKEVDRYNNCIKANHFEEAKEIGVELKNKLEKMKRKHVEGYGIAEEKIEKEKGKVMTSVK